MATSSPERRTPQLAADFARRIMPVAAFVGILVAFGPPLLYSAMAWSRLESQAIVYANHMAHALEDVAARQPQLWRYNAHKVIEATTGSSALWELGAVQIADCEGGTLFSSDDLGVGTDDPGGPVAWAPIVVSGRAVAHVQVTMDVHVLVARSLKLGLGTGLAGAVLGLFLFVFPTRVVRRQSAALETALEQLAGTERQLVKANADLQRRVDGAVSEVRDLSGRVLSIQETERRRIAMDLHDGIGQLITGLRMDLEMASQSPERLERALALCDRLLSELRVIVRDLRPLELETSTLQEALRGYAERFETRTGIETSLRWQGPEIVSQAVAICLWRAVQEALTNVGRYSEATEVGVRLIIDKEGVTLGIEDDGCGFDAELPTQGTGLRSMRERLAFLGGTCEVESSPGAGVTIKARVPLEQGGEGR